MSSTTTPQEETKRTYVKPTVEKVHLDPKQSILATCSTSVPLAQSATGCDL